MPAHTPRSLLRQKLGQFWTQPDLAKLIVEQIPSHSSYVLDLAAGDGALLAAMRIVSPKATLVGFDIDERAIRASQARGREGLVRIGDGLKKRLRHHEEATCAGVANPPFCEVAVSPTNRRLLDQALPAPASAFGPKRLELLFLARYLTWARKNSAVISILMPCGFADGDMYSRYRSALLSNYGVRRVIEVPGGLFSCTEARTVLLVIDGLQTRTKRIDICALQKDGSIDVVHSGLVAPGERLDARYWAGKKLSQSFSARLCDIGVEIERGTMTNCEARRRQLPIIHTTDLARVRGGELQLGPGGDSEGVLVRAGDILLPRTGTRVAWRPTVVTDGIGAITDHVFRIRAPENVREAVHESFHSPLFPQWLQAVSKGVCATVLTKRELLEMPAFALT